VKLFNEELIHLRKDEYAECDDKDSELVKMLDVKELSPVFRHCKALERE
jgi:phage pi2 protein 07